MRSDDSQNFHLTAFYWNICHYSSRNCSVASEARLSSTQDQNSGWCYGKGKNEGYPVPMPASPQCLVLLLVGLSINLRQPLSIRWFRHDTDTSRSVLALVNRFLSCSKWWCRASDWLLYFCVPLRYLLGSEPRTAMADTGERLLLQLMQKRAVLCDSG